MKMALDLAIKAKGRTSPNPMVGAVVVCLEKVIGTGYHKQAGTEHAEIIAIQSAGKQTFGATLYVNLEPCCHYGKTGPCTEAIIQSGIQKVVLAMEDPNPLVAGKGTQQLKKAGIEVVTDVLQEEARQINEVYIKYIQTQLPFVVLKTAMSLDGKIATSSGDSQWITGKASRAYAHQLRDTYDAVLVGVNTVLTDDPRLTVRIPGHIGKNPVRVVLDSQLRIPLTSSIVQNACNLKTIVATTTNANQHKMDLLLDHGVDLCLAGEGPKVDISCLLKKLVCEHSITSVLVEGGAEVNASFLSAGVVDKIYWMLAPIMMGSHESKGPIASMGIDKVDQAFRFRVSTLRQLNGDILVEGYPMKAIKTPCLLE